MTLAEIRATIDDFVAATRRAERLGLAAIELHCAHGYLLHQFLSPIANHRDDAYGGSLANRMRLPLQIFEAIRAAWPASRPLGVRVSASDWLELSGTASWTLDDTVTFARALQQRGCDWIDVSSGGVSPTQKIALGPGYQVPFAERVKRETGMATIAVGLITQPRQAEAIIGAGEADMVAMARAMLWNPRWVWHAAAELGGHVLPPPQYGRAAPREHAQLFAQVPMGMR
jgi:NADPH2 dehydrogenase